MSLFHDSSKGIVEIAQKDECIYNEIRNEFYFTKP
jgi:hypothetical protein